MRQPYILTQQAQRDIDEIWDAVAEENPAAAERLVDQIEQTLRRLPDAKSLGPSYDTTVPGVKHFPIPRTKYVLYFSRLRAAQQILRVLHGRRKFTSSLLAPEP
jgi:toxin ParE1/3/4